MATGTGSVSNGDSFHKAQPHLTRAIMVIVVDPEVGKQSSHDIHGDPWSVKWPYFRADMHVNKLCNFVTVSPIFGQKMGDTSKQKS